MNCRKARTKKILRSAISRAREISHFSLLNRNVFFNATFNSFVHFFIRVGQNNCGKGLKVCHIQPFMSTQSKGRQKEEENIFFLCLASTTIAHSFMWRERMEEIHNLQSFVFSQTLMPAIVKLRDGDYILILPPPSLPFTCKNEQQPVNDDKKENNSELKWQRKSGQIIFPFSDFDVSFDGVVNIRDGNEKEG